MRCLQVLGTGCAKCGQLAENARMAVLQLNIEANIEKISDITEILGFGVPGMPALVVDGKVMVAGRVPSVVEIGTWLEESPVESTSIEPQPSSQPQLVELCGCENRQAARDDKPCCGPVIPEKDWGSEPDVATWITGAIDTRPGSVPRIGTTLSWSDHLGTWKARWGIGRMRHWVKPRLYAVGHPTNDSPVLVSANYKMSFDRLRSALTGLDAWIVVLDTKGINVWCAAGKGTFGSDELIRQIQATNLPEIVSHGKVIVPQLGAPGVAAHEVRKRTGFRVVYGPVRANDIRAFLRSGMKATPQMRRVEFPLCDRLAVVPVELVMGAKYALLVMAALLVLSGLGPGGYAFSRILAVGLPSALLFLGAFLAGTVLGPLLLPWLPSRALSAKGVWIGMAMVAGLAVYVLKQSPAMRDWFTWGAWAILLPLTTSFVLMNFTGATTYTSLSGVRREMRLAVPIQAIAAIVGVALWIVARFV